MDLKWNLSQFSTINSSSLRMLGAKNEILSKYLLFFKFTPDNICFIHENVKAALVVKMNAAFHLTHKSWSLREDTIIVCVSVAQNTLDILDTDENYSKYSLVARVEEGRSSDLSDSGENLWIVPGAG